MEQGEFLFPQDGAEGTFEPGIGPPGDKILRLHLGVDWVIINPAKWGKVGQSGVISMLTGEYRHSMDPKGRVTVPSRFREELGERFYVMIGTDGCLNLLSEGEIAKVTEKIKALPPRESKLLLRKTFGQAAEAEPDKQGRILIPEKLREYAGLTKDVTLVGASTRAELWDTGRWEAYNAGQSPEDVEELMNLLTF